MSILDYIEKIKRENEGPRITTQEPRNMADGGRIGFKYGTSAFDIHTKKEAAFKAYKDYKKSYYSGRQKYPIITFREFLPIYAEENFADGGEVGQLVRNTVDGSRPGYAENIKKQKVGKYTIERKGKAGLLQPRDMVEEPLTTYEKIKLKKKFPKIKFNFKEYPNYGIASYDKKLKRKINLKEYDAVRRYIFRGFIDTTKFKVLPVSVQNEIKGQFPEVKKWDFKKYAFGVSPERIGERERRLKGLPPKDNRALVRKIARFVDEPEEFRYKFRVGYADGFMLYSMDRAYLQGNENYKPIKRGGKVVGFIDYTKDGGGKKYYYNGYIVNNKLKPGEKIIKDHPHFNNIKKFHNVALRSKLTLDETSNVFKQMFPKGFDTNKIKFNDLIQFVSNRASKRNIYSAIVKHHTMGVGTNPTKDLQILTSVFNKQADDIGALIKKKDFSRVQELKDKGIRIVVDGKAYGAPKETAEAGYKRIVSDVTKDVKTWKPKDFKEFNKYLQSFCAYGKSTGGRIGFKTGSCSPEVAKRNFLLATNDVRTGRVTGEAAEQIAKNAGKVVAKAGSKSALATIFGPAGIGIDIAYEVGSVGIDMYAGKPWKEAVQDNWIAGAFMPGTGQEEFHRRLFEEYPVGYPEEDKTKKYPEAKPYGSGLDLIDAYNKKQKQIDRLEADTTARGRAEAEKRLPGLERDLRGIAASYNALGNVMQPGSPEYENYMAAVTEARDADKAKSGASAAKLKMELDRPISDRYKPELKSDLKIDFELPPNYTTFKPDLPTKERVTEYFKEEGYDISPQEADEIRTREKWRQLFEQPGIRGTQDWRGAGGGMVGIRKPNALPPTGGPQSGGLPSLYNNVRKL